MKFEMVRNEFEIVLNKRIYIIVCRINRKKRIIEMIKKLYSIKNMYAHNTF